MCIFMVYMGPNEGMRGCFNILLSLVTHIQRATNLTVILLLRIHLGKRQCSICSLSNTEETGTIHAFPRIIMIAIMDTRTNYLESAAP